MTQQFLPHQIRVQTHVLAGSVKREVPALPLKNPPVSGHLLPKHLPLQAAFRQHATPALKAQAAAQVAEMVTGTDQHLAAKPLPPVVAIVRDVLVVVFLYDFAHYFSGGS